jgi:hypothetical protein
MSQTWRVRRGQDADAAQRQQLTTPALLLGLCFYQVQNRTDPNHSLNFHQHFFTSSGQRLGLRTILTQDGYDASLHLAHRTEIVTDLERSTCVTQQLWVAAGLF